MTLNTPRHERHMTAIWLTIALVLIGLAGHQIDRNQQEYRAAVIEYKQINPAQ